MTPCSAASSPFAAARTGCHGTILRSKTTTKRESRKPLVFSFCVLRPRVNARTCRSVPRQGAYSPERVRYGPLPLPGGVGLTRVRAASDMVCPNSRPLRSPLSRAKVAVPWPKSDAACPSGDTVAGSAMGSLISLISPAAPADALAGTTSIVTSRSRCCAHAPDVPRMRTAPIAYRVIRFMIPPSLPVNFLFRELDGLHARSARVVDFDLQPEHLAAPAVRQARHEFLLRRSARDQGKLHQVPAFAQVRLPGELAPVAVADELDVLGYREAQGGGFQRLRAVEHEAHGLGPIDRQRHRLHRIRARGEEHPEGHAQHQRCRERHADHWAPFGARCAGRRTRRARQGLGYEARVQCGRGKSAHGFQHRHRVLMPLAAIRATRQVLLNRLPPESVEPPVEQVVQSLCEVAAFHFDRFSYPLTRSPAEKGSIGSSARNRWRARCRRDLRVPSGVSSIVSSSSRLYPSTSCIATTARCSGLSRSSARRMRSRCPVRSAFSSGPFCVAGSASRGLSSPSASATSSTIGERARWRTESTYWL